MADSISRRFAADTAAKVAATVADRGASYGPPEINFERIAQWWRVWILQRYGVDLPLTAFDAGMMQGLIKLARQVETPTHADSALDGPTYWMLAVGCQLDAHVAAQCEDATSAPVFDPPFLAKF